MKKYEPYMEAIYAHEPFGDHGIKRTNRILNNEIGKKRKQLELETN
jgi:hypothetical protein